MNFAKNIHEYCESFLDLVYPRNCVVCKDALEKVEKHICIKCELKLPIVSIEQGFDTEEFKSRLWGRTPVNNCFAYLRYDKSTCIKSILKEIKYKGNRELAEYMGLMMGSYYMGNFRPNFDIVIPVPLHPKKEKLRGFNQSTLIAKGFSESTGTTLDTSIVIRKKNTKTQTQMNRNERWENVKTIFSVEDKDRLKNKTVLLLDDVVTTGSTLESLAETLINAGVEKINLAVLALAI